MVNIYRCFVCDLGIHKIFENGSMGNLADGAFLSKCAHKATIEVNETGTVASTARTGLYGGGTGKPPKPINFIADHPFLYMITKDLHPLVIGIHN